MTLTRRERRELTAVHAEIMKALMTAGKRIDTPVLDHLTNALTHLANVLVEPELPELPGWEQNIHDY